MRSYVVEKKRARAIKSYLRSHGGQAVVRRLLPQDLIASAVVDLLRSDFPGGIAACDVDDEVFRRTCDAYMIYHGLRDVVPLADISRLSEMIIAQAPETRGGRTFF